MTSKEIQCTVKMKTGADVYFWAYLVSAARGKLRFKFPGERDSRLLLTSGANMVPCLQDSAVQVVLRPRRKFSTGHCRLKVAASGTDHRR